MSNTSHYYLRTIVEEATDGGQVEYGSSIRDSLNTALNTSLRNVRSKLHRLEFQPLPEKERYQLVPTYFAPKFDILTYLGFRQLERRGELTAGQAKTFLRLHQEYTEALSKMPLPSSLVELPPQYLIEATGGAEQRYTREGAFKIAAAVNAKTIAKRREKSKGVDTIWAVVVEIGREIPFAREQMISLGQPGLMHIGTTCQVTMNPTRIVEPTAGELHRHRIEWTEYLRSASA